MIAVKAVEEPVRRLNRSLKLFDSTMIVAGSILLALGSRSSLHAHCTG
jgi:hypothetical protein